MAGTKVPTSVRPENAIEKEDPSDWTRPLGSMPEPASSSKRPGQYSSVAPRAVVERFGAKTLQGIAPSIRSGSISSVPPPISSVPPPNSSVPPPVEKALAPASRLAALVSAPGPIVARVAPNESSLSSDQAADSAVARASSPLSASTLAIHAPDSLRMTSDFPASSRRGPVTDIGEWQQVWLAMQSRPWKSIALVPVDKSASESALRLAHALVEIGTEHLKQAMEVLDYRRVSLGEVEARIGQLTSLVANGKRTLVVIGSILDSPACHRLARSADGAVLCVTLGSSDVTSAKKSVEAIGKDRFLGSVAFRARKAKAKPKTKPKTV